MLQLAALFDDEDAIAELAGYLEDLWAAGDERERAVAIFTAYAQAAPLFDHRRLTANWMARLCGGGGGGQAPLEEAARPALAALLTRVGETTMALEEATEGLYTAKERLSSRLDLAGLAKQVIVPALIQPAVSPSCRHQAHLVSRRLVRASSYGWTAGSLAPLCGALIRVASSTNREDSRVEGLEGLVEMIELHAALVKPFWPQIQRLLNQGLLEHAPRLGVIREEEVAVRLFSERGMRILLPLLPRPEALLREWLAGLSGEAAAPHDGEDEEGTLLYAAPVALCLLPLISRLPQAKLLEQEASVLAALRIRLVDADGQVRAAALSLRDALAPFIPAVSKLTVI